MAFFATVKNVKTKKSILITVLFLYSIGGAVYAQEQRRERKKRQEAATPQPSIPKDQPAPAHLVADTLPNAVISGRLIDEETGLPLVDASVKVVGLPKGALADLNGVFRIESLKPGEYYLELEYAGYQPKRIGPVTTRNGSPARVDAVMKEATVELQTVLIEEKAREASDAAMLAAQKALPVVADGFSGDMILRETSDFQLNTVFRRLPGVSLIDERFLVVRGMVERYNNVLLNNAPLPITDMERVFFDFSNLPSNMISSLKLTKSFSPDLNGDYGGGYIQINTLDMPEKTGFRAYLQATYNSRATFKSFESQITNPLPKDFPNAQAVQATQPYDEQNLAYARMLPDNMNFRTYTAPPGLAGGLSYELRTKLAGKDLGVVAFLNHNEAYRTNHFVINTLANYDTLAGLNPINSVSDGPWNERVRNTGAMLNFSIRPNSTSKISFKNIFSHNDENISYSGYGWYVYPPDFDTIPLLYLARRTVKNTLYHGQLVGEHVFKKAGASEGISLEWQGNFSYNRVSEPGFHNYSYEASGPDAALYFGSYNDPYYPFAFIGYQNNYVAGAQAAATFPVRVKNVKGRVKTGVYSLVRSREFVSRKMGLHVLFDSTETPIMGLPDSILHLDNVHHIHSAANIGEGGFYLHDVTTPYHNFNSLSGNAAAFVQADLNLTRRLRILFGLRGDYFNQTVNLVYPDSGQDTRLVDRQSNALLPSVNLTYALTPKLNLRGAYSESITRPIDRELVPLGFFNHLMSIASVGNLGLQASRISNVDLRAEYFPSGVEVMSFSLFYKYFRNPIEQALTDGSDLNIQTYELLNQPNAHVAGIEMEVRRNLGRLLKLPALENLTVYANLALLQSRVNLENPGQLFNSGRRLQGQANYMLNAGFIFKEQYSKLDMGVFYNYISDRIAMLGIGDQKFASFWEIGRHVVEMQISRKFGERFEARISLPDLLNQPLLWVQIYDGRTQYDKNKDQTVRSTQRGYQANLTVTYRF